MFNIGRIAHIPIWWLSQSKKNFNVPHVVNCSTSYHALFEQAKDPIMVTDFKGNIIDANSSFCTLFGYSKKELLLLNVRVLLDSQHMVAKPIRFDLLEMGENVFNERKMLSKDGQIIYVEANAKRFAENRILVIARNITDRKIVEEVLKTSEANLQTIFRNTDTIYVLLDNSLKILSYNNKAIYFAKTELGHNMEISEYFLEYFPEEKRDILKASMMEVLKGLHINYEVSYIQPSGLHNWYHVRMFPISKDDNSIVGLMMAVSDITQKKLLEQELLNQKVKEQKNVLQAILRTQEIERNRLGQELHDNINQILSSVKLYLSMIEQEAGACNDLINRTKELVALSIHEIRLLSQQQVTPPKTFQLNTLIEELANDLNMNQSEIKFKVNIACNLDISEDLKLNVYRIIQEQFNNIIKYSNAKTAFTSIENKEGFLKIDIQDDGNGFDPLLKKKGLGISNITNRVESYNGQITLESKPGNGCTLKIIIPLEVESHQMDRKINN